MLILHLLNIKNMVVKIILPRNIILKPILGINLNILASEFHINLAN